MKTIVQKLTLGRFMYRLPSGQKSVALTFDDGPHPEHTPRILSILKEEGVKASFFLVGCKAVEHPELVRAMVKDGHAVGSHSYAHARINSMNGKSLSDDLEKTFDCIREASGVRTLLYRPPYGKVTGALLGHALRRNIRLVLWSLDSRDFEEKDPDTLCREVSRAKAGDILLLHEDYAHTVKALKRMVRTLKSMQLNFVTVNGPGAAS